MPSAKVSENFDIHIPKELQDELKIRPGQKFNFAAQDGVLFLVPDNGKGIEGLIGIAKGADTSGFRDRP
ncbi:MAG: AbrB/MazE/SpoVT family DNA-binding domain-containing protein [Rhodospirillaceae bacterium]|nr:MAG: AbrB/MazE/SpoVT family DNA-binding domain-containing protein [Rhodospirillaceae bacterium]